MRRIKSLADGVTLLRQESPEELDAFRSRLSAWVDRVEALGLTPRDLGEEHLEAQKRPARAARFVARQAVAAVVGLPIALVGAVFWAVPFWAVHLLWRLTGVERDTGATVKVLGSLVFFPLWWVAAVVGICAESGTAITPQGGNTGLVSGQIPQGEVLVVAGGPAAAYEAMMELIDDAQLLKIVKQRQHEKSVRVSLDEL